MSDAKTFFWPRNDDTQQRLQWKTAAMLFVGLGLAGVDVFSDTASHSGTWFVFHAVTDCVIGTLTYAPGTRTGSLVGVTVKAGDRLYGDFRSVAVSSGTYEMYRSPL